MTLLLSRHSFLWALVRGSAHYLIPALRRRVLEAFPQSPYRVTLSVGWGAAGRFPSSQETNESPEALREGSAFEPQFHWFLSSKHSTQCISQPPWVCESPGNLVKLSVLILQVRVGPRRLNFQRVVRETPRLIPGLHFEPVGCHSCHHTADTILQSPESEMLEGIAV